MGDLSQDQQLLIGILVVLILVLLFCIQRKRRGAEGLSAEQRAAELPSLKFKSDVEGVESSMAEMGQDNCAYRHRAPNDFEEIDIVGQRWQSEAFVKGHASTPFMSGYSNYSAVYCDDATAALRGAEFVDRDENPVRGVGLKAQAPIALSDHILKDTDLSDFRPSYGAARGSVTI